MKRFVLILLAAMLLFPTALAEDTDLTTEPVAFFELMTQGEVQQLFDQSTADMQSALGSAAGLKSGWVQITQMFGAYEGIQNVSAVEQNGLVVATISCSFQNADVTFTVAVTSDHLLSGLTVTSATQKAAAESTADTSRFVSEPVTLRAGKADETHGLLTLPVGDGPFPTVIMMQGSGPSDMNETAFGIAIFRDLAEGLAQAGVASIRYDKYTYAHADLVTADITIEQEYVIDARDALALLQGDSRIGDIYLLGHSLGGMLVPRIMQTLGADALAGGVIVCGTPLPLWEIQYHQNQAYIATLPQADQVTANASIEKELEKLDEMPSLSAEALQSMTFFGAPAPYHMDLISVDAAQMAIALQKPLLIIQGGKDWQVTPADGIEAWQAALNGQLEADYLLYPNLTHMLTELDTESAGDTSDYHSGNPLSQELIGDIAAWILQ